MIEEEDVMRKLVRARKYGGREKHSSGAVPWKAAEFLRVVQEALSEIPEEHLSEAIISIEPEHEFGDSYECLDIGYYRPMTLGEIVEHHAQELRDWEARLAEAEERTQKCRDRIALRSATYKIEPAAELPA